ncbi:O-antigen ligase family protein [Marinobacter sp. KMM 10035]|uniref:O-antigen ligase family protein n=1 Tax=Marinobacter sp. KMM 10035 TaxID=3134034 RepID=UPI00397A5C00
MIVAASFLALTVPYSGSLYVWVEPGLYAGFFFGFVALGQFISSVKWEARVAVAVVYAAVIAAALYGAITLMIFVFALSDQVANLSAFIPWGFVNIRYWGHIATWLMPLLALAVLIGPLREQKLWRFLAATGAALWWWIIFLSASRGTLIGLAFGVLLAMALIGRPALPWLKMFGRYFIYGVIAWLVLSVVIPLVILDHSELRTLHATTSGRMPLFVEAWRMSLENFPFGMGPQSWLTHEVITDEYKKSSKFAHPHNMYLMWAAEYGWLIIGSLLLLAGQAIRLFWHRREEMRANHEGVRVLPLAAFTASVSAALVHASASSVFIAPGSMLVGFMVLCVFWGLISPSSTRVPQKGKARGLFAAVATLLFGILAIFWLREVAIYHHAMEDDRDSRYEGVPYGTPPRFWYYGDFPRRLPGQ